jgi:prophage regulatory protein
MIDKVPANELLLKPELKQLVPLSDTTIWRMERDNAFPRRIVLSRKRVAWKRSEVMAFIAARMAAREPQAA